MHPPRTCRSPGASRIIRERAFSLVEVTIALGIVSIALLSVMGLMPVGLTTMREAMDQTMEAQITRRVAGEAALVPFDKLDAYVASGPFFFTQDGTLQAARDGQTRYAVTLRPTPARYPGSSNAANLSESLAAFLVETTRSADGVDIWRSTNIIHVPNTGNSAY